MYMCVDWWGQSAVDINLSVDTAMSSVCLNLQLILLDGVEDECLWSH